MHDELKKVLESFGFPELPNGNNTTHLPALLGQKINSILEVTVDTLVSIDFTKGKQVDLETVAAIRVQLEVLELVRRLYVPQPD